MTNDPAQQSRYSPPVRRIGGLLMVYLAVYLLINVIGLKYVVVLQPANNSNIAEAVAILSGTLQLPERTYDTAVVNGKVQGGLLDASWKERLPVELQDRYQQILDDLEHELPGH